MGLLDIIKSLLVESKKVEVDKLPSQGLFYKDDFSIKIKKAEIEDIIDYEYNFDKNNLIVSIDCIKRIVERNVILSENYTYHDIKSVDIIFIFLEIVKFTKNKEIKIPYINNMGAEDIVSFDEDHFNYFDFNQYQKYYNEEEKSYLVNGYKFTLPSIGVETSLTNFIGSKETEEDIKKLNGYSYDFMFFLGDKRHLRFDEIDNLIEIFNNDMDEEEKVKISKIVEMFKGIVAYTLVVDGHPVEIKSKLNLENIWKIS